MKKNKTRDCRRHLFTKMGILIVFGTGYLLYRLIRSLSFVSSGLGGEPVVIPGPRHIQGAL
jgi:hypothetical protein